MWEVPNMGIICLLTNSKKKKRKSIGKLLRVCLFLNWISHRKVPWLLAVKNTGFEAFLFWETARQKRGVCKSQDVCGPDVWLWVSFPWGGQVGDCPIPSPPASNQLVLGRFGGVHVTILRLLKFCFQATLMVNNTISQTVPWYKLLSIKPGSWQGLSESFLCLLCFLFLDGNKDSCHHTEASLTFINFLGVPGSNLSPFHLLAVHTSWKDVGLFYLLGGKDLLSGTCCLETNRLPDHRLLGLSSALCYSTWLQWSQLSSPDLQQALLVDGVWLLLLGCSSLC